MSQPITFSSLQELHTKLWNNANNRWFQQDDNDQKRKIYTTDPEGTEGTILEELIFPETPSDEATNLEVEGAEYGIPWNLIERGDMKVKANLSVDDIKEEWWKYNPRMDSRGGRKKTRRKKCKRKSGRNPLHE